MRPGAPVVTVAVLLLCAGCSDRPVPATISGAGAPTPPAPWFHDEAEARGLDFQYQSGQSKRRLFPEIMGGGGALADLDGDGDLDAYLVQSGRVESEERPLNRLFANNGDGHFLKVDESGDAADDGYGMGVAAGDYDNDGDVDLYVTNVGPNRLLRNDGGFHFSDVSAAAGVAGREWSATAAFLDLDADDDLDLFVVNYVSWSVETQLDCYSRVTGLLDYCSPVDYIAARDRLYRNNGDGTFSDISAAAGLDVAFGHGLGVVGADFDRDGLTDVFVANDTTRNQLWLNRGGLEFQDESALWGCAVDENGAMKAGMGVAAVDQDNNGFPDILVVNLAGETDSFFRNAGTFFRDETASVGLVTGTRRYTRFGVGLMDFDNDGQLDIYQANGAINEGQVRRSQRVGYAAVAGTADGYAEPNVLLRGMPNGRFERVEPPGGTERPLIQTSRGLAVGDVDGDGGLDLLVVNRDGPANLLMNQVAHRGGWIAFRALTRAGRDAHGATVSANVGPVRMSRDVQVAGSYMAASSPIVHFGLGDRTAVRDVVVAWPGGTREAFGDFTAGGIRVLRQGQGTAISR